MTDDFGNIFLNGVLNKLIVNELQHSFSDIPDKYLTTINIRWAISFFSD